MAVTSELLAHQDVHRRRQRALLVAVAVTALLYVIPYGRFVAWPLLLLSTLAHEMGHGVAAVLAGGDFQQFEMWANGSGVAQHAGSYGRLGIAFISAGGLVGPAVAAALLFALARRPTAARGALYGLGGALLLADVLVVRNLFGLFFVGALGALLILAARSLAPGRAQDVLVFVAVQLALSVYSRGDYLFVEQAMTTAGAMPSDVAQMAQALLLPYWFWGVVCGAFSVAVLVLGLWLYLRKRRVSA